MRVEIPKPDGRKRKLGIPTVLDRLIQQAIAQIMQEEWDSEFHNNSYGFRPYRNAHQAIGYAQTAVRQGYDWVIDCDLDWELEKRNLRFARYADDFVVFVGSKTAGERVMESLQRFIGESLTLTVNTQCRNTESSARSGQMGSTTIAVLYLEAMGKQRLSNAQKAGYRQISGVEYGEVCSWILAYKW